MSVLQEIAYHLTIRPRMYFLKKLLPEALIVPCGSRYVCNPPVYGTDVDFLVYSECSIHDRLVKARYKKQVYVHYAGQGSDFDSWRRGAVNLIVTSDKKFAERHRIATHVCRSRNIRDKFNRIVVYETLRGGTDYIGALKDTYPSAVNLDDDLKNMLLGVSGPYGNTLCKVYMAQHGLD